MTQKSGKGLSDVSLGPTAKQVAVVLEQTAYKGGETLVGMVHAGTRQCAITLRKAVAEALDELTAAGYVESLIPCSKRADIAWCMPPLQRTYRLTEAGHAWRCRNNVSFGGKDTLRGH